MARMAKPHWRYWCEFGEHEIKRGERSMHVYPVPVCPAFPDGGSNGQGATCCEACHSEVQQSQIDQGLLIPRSPSL